MQHQIKSKNKKSIDWTFDYTVIEDIKFKVDNKNRVITKRMNSYYTKEPKTLEWINSFEPNSVLVDIGANIGVYTMYAAKRGHTVYAYEPQAQNFSELMINIYLNGFSDNVHAYPFAIMDENSIGKMSLLSVVPGQSHNDYNIDDGRFKQGVAAFTLDHLDVAPNHIKIDVDGLEAKVLQGMPKTLEKTESVLIEVTNKDELKPLLDLGFKIDESMTYQLSPKETNYDLRKS
jgi:FkbM family methyltransferase